MACIDRAQNVWARNSYSRRKLFYPNCSNNFSQGDLNRYPLVDRRQEKFTSKIWIAQVMRQTHVPIPTSPCHVSPPYSQPNSVLPRRYLWSATICLRPQEARSLQLRLLQSIVGTQARNPSVLPRLHHPQLCDRPGCRLQNATPLPESVFGYPRLDSSTIRETDSFLAQSDIHG
jgi:hypothetical protein